MQKQLWSHITHGITGGCKSNQIASIIYKYIEDNVLNDIHNLIMYSNNYCDRNKNIFNLNIKSK